MIQRYVCLEHPRSSSYWAFIETIDTPPCGASVAVIKVQSHRVLLERVLPDGLRRQPVVPRAGPIPPPIRMEPRLRVPLLPRQQELLRRWRPIRRGTPLQVVLNHKDGSTDTITANHSYNAQQIEWFKAGGALNVIRSQAIK